MKIKVLIVGSYLSIILSFLSFQQVSLVYAAAFSYKKPLIVASIFPFYDFAKEISGSYANVDLLLPPGASPHCWEPRPSDVALLKHADVIIIVGPLEPWAKVVLNAIGCKARFIIKAAEGAPLIKKGSSNKEIDPHVWLDFKWDTVIVRRIAKALCSIDPLHKDFYRKRAQRLIKELLSLDKQYRTTIKSLKLKYLVVAGHGAFSYLCRAYGIKQISLCGISPDAQPTVLRLVHIINFIKKHHIKAFFYEETGPKKPAITIEEETGVKAWPLTPAASLTREEIKRNVTFIGLMYKNLNILKKAFKLHSVSASSASTYTSSSTYKMSWSSHWASNHRMTHGII